METLNAAIDARGRQTTGYSQRVSVYAAIARQFDLPESIIINH